MRFVPFLMILCLVSLYFCMGCDEPDLVFTPNDIYVSKDPAACRSITVDCEIHNTDPKLQYRWFAFSDESGCGCRAKITSSRKNP